MCMEVVENVCVLVDKSNYRLFRGWESESVGGHMTQSNFPGPKLHTLFTSLTKQMCWANAAVMRSAWRKRGGGGEDEKCKVRKEERDDRSDRQIHRWMENPLQ